MAKRYISCEFTVDLRGANVNRKEATALLCELGSHHLVNPNLVIIEQRKSDKYGLQIRGDYNRQAIVTFLKKKHLPLSFEMDNAYLIIFKP